MRIKGKKFTYLVQKKRLPNGVTMHLEMIEHPGAALIVPFMAKNRVIFLQQYRAVFGKILLELPAGTLDKRESPLICAHRELTEETGFSASKWKALGKIYPVPGYSTEVIHIFKAENLKKDFAAQDRDEIIQTKILTPEEISRLFRQGKILDAKTICALTLCQWL